MAEDVLILDEFLPYRLNRLADAVSREFAALYKEGFGLTRPEWRTLATLGQFGTATAGTVGEHSAMHKTKVSRAVAALERRRWLSRKADAGDRRIEHLTLTAAGRKAYREMVPIARAFEARFLADFDARDRAAIPRVVTLLEQAAGLSGSAAGIRNQC